MVRREQFSHRVDIRKRYVPDYVDSRSRKMRTWDAGFVYFPDFEYMDTWDLPLVPTSGEGAPTQIVDACGAVGADLRWRRYGPDIYLDNSRWRISLLEDGYCHVQLAPGPRPHMKASGTEQLKSFAAGAPHMDQSLAEVTVLIADAVQSELAGYPPHIQWPIEEKRLLLPQIRSDRAIWRDPRTDVLVAEIGFLDQAST